MVGIDSKKLLSKYYQSIIVEKREISCVNDMIKNESSIVISSKFIDIATNKNKLWFSDFFLCHLHIYLYISFSFT